MGSDVSPPAFFANRAVGGAICPQCGYCWYTVATLSMCSVASKDAVNGWFKADPASPTLHETGHCSHRWIHAKPP